MLLHPNTHRTALKHIVKKKKKYFTDRVIKGLELIKKSFK